MLNLSSFSTKKHIIIINLINNCWFCIQFKSLDKFQVSHFQINNTKIDNLIIVIWKSKYSCRTLNNSVWPTDFNHLISVRRTCWYFYLFDNWWSLLLFWNRITIVIIFFLLIVIFIFFFFNIFLFLWSRSFFMDISISVLLVVWVSCFVHICNCENLVWMWISWPNAEITISASSRKIFITKLAVW